MTTRTPGRGPPARELSTIAPAADPQQASARKTQLGGRAGTITTVTAHALDLQSFDPPALNGAELSPQAVLASCEAIIHSTPEQRASWGYLAPGRRDVIAAGALVWSEVVTRVVERTTAAGRPLERVTTSLYDILDGIALSLVPAQAGPEGDEV